MNFIQKLGKIVKKNNSLVCVGLDSNFDKIPDKFKKGNLSYGGAQFEFNKYIIDQTHDLVCCYKPNSAFYEARGVEGIKELKTTFDYINSKYPQIPTILDAKRGDIGSTNKGYVSFAFDYLKAGAVTLHPYLGKEALSPFLERSDKGCIILCRTSNPGAGEFQDLQVDKHKIYQIVAKKISSQWNINNNCLLVIGATYPKELKEIREIVGDKMWFLVPGVGAQGGDLEKTVSAGHNRDHTGMIINSSRGIIFSPDPREACQELKKEINKYRV